MDMEQQRHPDPEHRDAWPVRLLSCGRALGQRAVKGGLDA